MEDGAMVQVLPGRTEGSVILHTGNGFYYSIKEVRQRRARLICRRYKATGCNATASLDLETGIVRPLLAHTCERDPLFVEDVRVRGEILEAAGQNLLGCSVRKVLRDLKLRLDPELASRFTISRMHAPMYAARAANYPKIPKTLIHLGVLLGLPNLRPICQTVDRQDFIFQGVAGNVSDKTVCVVFASGRMLQWLNSRPNIHMDGTFRKRPRKPKCSQIYNIVTNFESCIVCLARVLMMSRTEKAYTALLEYLKTLAPGLAPNTIHCDFERSVMNSISLVFPNSDIVGCLWHYGACIGRKSQKLGLSSLAAENDLVYSYIRIVGGAPLLPASLIEQGIEEIWKEVKTTGWADELRPLFRYFRKEWLPRRNELSCFSHRERTNNASESDNRMLANVAPQNHPNIWRLVGGFVQLEHLAYCDKIAAERGNPVTQSQRWKTVANNKRVVNQSNLLVADQITPATFLKNTSWVALGAVNHGLRLDYNSDNSENED